MKKINIRFVKMNKRKKLKDLSNAFCSNEEKRGRETMKENPGGLVTGCRGKRQQISGDNQAFETQFSSFNPLTFEKCTILFVTSVTSSASADAAINMSMEPIGVPCASSSVLRPA